MSMYPLCTLIREHALLEMIAHLAVQSSTPTRNDNAILFIDTSTMLENNTAYSVTRAPYLTIIASNDWPWLVNQ